MSQELEYETKSLLSPTDFDTLVNEFKLINILPVQQHNHYFETPNFSFRQAGAALRVREKNGNFTLTLKQPAEDGGLLETHQQLNEEEMKLALNDGIFPNGLVTVQLQDLQLSNETMQFLGTLTTERLELPYSNGTLVLDKSSYLHKEDYEVEFEGTSMDHAQETLTKLLHDQGIHQKETPNKVARFFTRKAELEAGHSK